MSNGTREHGFNDRPTPLDNLEALLAANPDLYVTRDTLGEIRVTSKIQVACDISTRQPIFDMTRERSYSVHPRNFDLETGEVTEALISVSDVRKDRQETDNLVYSYIGLKTEPDKQSVDVALRGASDLDVRESIETVRKGFAIFDALLRVDPLARTLIHPRTYDSMHARGPLAQLIDPGFVLEEDQVEPMYKPEAWRGMYVLLQKNILPEDVPEPTSQ